MKLNFPCQIKLGSKNLVVRVWAGGTSTTPNYLAAHFAKQNTKFSGGESEGGAGIHFPHTPFSSRPARAVGFSRRAERGGQSAPFSFCSKKVRAFSNKGHQVGNPPAKIRKGGGAAPLKTAKEPVKNMGSNHILILGEENFLIQ